MTTESVGNPYRVLKPSLESLDHSTISEGSHSNTIPYHENLMSVVESSQVQSGKVESRCHVM